jgi:Cu-Zn family superoxide dismutase
MKTALSMMLVLVFAASTYTATAQGQPETKKSSKVQPKADAHDHAHDAPPLPTKAVCVLVPTKGNDVRGTITLNESKSGTEIAGEVRGLTPGKHGFHIHEFGDLRSDDGAAAGAHYDPHGHKHGGLDDKERHVGDLGNITANNSGVANVKLTVRDLKVHFVVGRSLVVHAKEDDLKTQPSGDSGPRVAVGIIGVASDKPPQSTPASAGAGSKKTK